MGKNDGKNGYWVFLLPITGYSGFLFRVLIIEILPCFFHTVSKAFDVSHQKKDISFSLL